MSLPIKNIHLPEVHQNADELTKEMLEHEQLDAPVYHRFAPGLYIREIHMPANSFVVGHEHTTEHFNVMLQGHLLMINEDGTVTEYIAPQSYTAKPGRKVALILEDVVWQNIFPADTKDIDILEERLLIKTESFLLNEKMQFAADKISHEADRISYIKTLEKHNIIDCISENIDNEIDFPCEVHAHRIAKSPIHGLGYFLTVGAPAGFILAPAAIDNNHTPAFIYINHSHDPNAELRKGQDGNIYLVAIKDIDGCIGGSVGTEVTVDYSVIIELMNKEIKRGDIPWLLSGQ